MKKSEEKRKLVEELTELYQQLNVDQLYQLPDHRNSKAWLSEAAAILKNLDETDFQSFLNHRQHLYPSIPLSTRKHAAEQIDGFVRQKVAEYKRYDFNDSNKTAPYIRQELIEKFKTKKDRFNYKKLIGLLEELNSNYADGHPYASAMLLRGILDHIPPLLGLNYFEEVVNNYSWTRTDKGYMEKLLDFKREGDDALHRQISEREDYLSIGDLPSSNRINRLLEECLLKAGTIKKIVSARGVVESAKNKKLKGRGIKVKLLDKIVSWANYAISHHVWSSFRIPIEIDNYESDLPDFLSASLIAVSRRGQWRAPYFTFEGVSNQNQEFRIEPHDIKRVSIFISNRQIGEPRQIEMPDFDRATLRLIISARSGQKIAIPIEKEWIVKG